LQRGRARRIVDQTDIQSVLWPVDAKLGATECEKRRYAAEQLFHAHAVTPQKEVGCTFEIVEKASLEHCLTLERFPRLLNR
jgi:hypothetical protein